MACARRNDGPPQVSRALRILLDVYPEKLANRWSLVKSASENVNSSVACGQFLNQPRRCSCEAAANFLFEEFGMGVTPVSMINKG